MVIVSWLGVLPIVTVIFSVFGHWLNLLPTLVRALAFTALMVTLMTCVVMPRLTRLFSIWLYPDREYHLLSRGAPSEKRSDATLHATTREIEVRVARDRGG